MGTVVLLAWLCRVLPLEGLPSGLQEACGILRLCNRQMFRVYRALSVPGSAIAEGAVPAGVGSRPRGSGAARGAGCKT
ncbi:MAG: hypothetical protein ACLT9S_08705 [Faecalibacterium sp.]